MTSSTKRPDSTERHAWLVGIAIFLSRICGFGRMLATTHFLGLTPAAGAFNVAMRIPNFLQNLLGEGVLSASFIPVHARLVAEGDEETAGRVASVVGSALALLIGVVTLLGLFFAHAITMPFVQGFDAGTQELTVQLVRIVFPGTALLVMSAWCLGILNSRRKFFLSYIAPVAWNGAMIAALLMGAPGRELSGTVMLLAWAATAGALLQLLMQLPHVLRLERALRPSLQILPAVRDVFRNAIPAVLSRGVVQVSAFVDLGIAGWLNPVAVSTLANAQTVYMLPVSMFGMAVAAAELPEMSSATGSSEAIHAKLRERLESGMRRVAFVVVPTVAGFVFLGRILLGIFENGLLTSDGARVIWYALMGSSVGLLAVTRARLLSSAFWALRDVRTPLRIALVRITLNAALGLLLAFPLRPLIITVLELCHQRVPDLEGGWVVAGAFGLTLAAGLSGWIEYLLLSRALRRVIGPLAPGGRQLARFWAAALVASAFSLSLDAWLLADLSSQFPPFVSNVTRALLALLSFGVVYLPLAGWRGRRRAAL